MKKMIQRMAGVGIYLVGTFLGFFKGEVAKEKFNFKVKSYYVEKQQAKQSRQFGDIKLDDFEINTYHQSI